MIKIYCEIFLRCFIVCFSAGAENIYVFMAAALAAAQRSTLSIKYMFRTSSHDLRAEIIMISVLPHAVRAKMGLRRLPPPPVEVHEHDHTIISYV